MIRVLEGDALTVLRTLPDRSVQSCVTSPPYWGLRDYNVPGQLGLEKTPAEYVANLVAVFREVRRVLRDDGVLWLNLGDSYANDTKWGGKSGGLNCTSLAGGYHGQRERRDTGLKPKDLVGIPWRVAFALQDDGWWLRSDIIWAKPNPMPESVTDRPTKAHEYIFLLAKSQRYYWDAEAVREATSPHSDFGNPIPDPSPYAMATGRRTITRLGHGSVGNPAGRNLRTVWTIATHPFAGAHFATFPPALVEPMVKASTSERGCCPKCGKAWERVVEKGEPRRAGWDFGPGKRGVANAHAEGPMDRNGQGQWDEGHYPTVRDTTTLGWKPACTCRSFYGCPECKGDGCDACSHTGKRLPDPVPCTVLDPFGGAGTTGLVASRLGRDAVLIELNPEYAEMARKRIRDDAPLLNGGME